MSGHFVEVFLFCGCFVLASVSSSVCFAFASSAPLQGLVDGKPMKESIAPPKSSFQSEGSIIHTHIHRQARPGTFVFPVRPLLSPANQSQKIYSLLCSFNTVLSLGGT